jgi:hypothetical protein
MGFDIWDAHFKRLATSHHDSYSSKYEVVPFEKLIKHAIYATALPVYRTSILNLVFKSETGGSTTIDKS